MMVRFRAAYVLGPNILGPNILGPLAACVGLALALGSPVRAEDLPSRTRGVRLLEPGEDMRPVSDFPELRPGFAGGVAPVLETMRVAVAEGPVSRLASLKPRAAPFALVEEQENPDLVWDPAARQVRAGGEIIAYDIGPEELAAVIDKMAVARGIERLSVKRPQPIALLSGNFVVHKGDKVEIEVGDVARRALVLFDIAGDGTVQALYPIGGDARIIGTRNFRWRFEAQEPFGADLVIAVTAPQPMEALVRGLREISQFRSAGDVLKLLAIAAPPDARIGALSLSSRP
jgi:hypothetical protein